MQFMYAGSVSIMALINMSLSVAQWLVEYSTTRKVFRRSLALNSVEDRIFPLSHAGAMMNIDEHFI